MQRSTRYLTIAAALLFCLCGAQAVASEEESIRQQFAAYWKHFSSSDFAAAAELIAADDLQATKEALLPVFLAAAKSDSKAVQEIASTFFGTVPAEKRAAMTPVEVYASLNRFIASTNAEAFKGLSSAVMEVDNVEVTGADATIHYHVRLKGTQQADSEKLVKKEGKWWLHLKQNPREIAEEFKSLLKL